MVGQRVVWGDRVEDKGECGQRRCRGWCGRCVWPGWVMCECG